MDGSPSSWRDALPPCDPLCDHGSNQRGIGREDIADEIDRVVTQLAGILPCRAQRAVEQHPADCGESYKQGPAPFDDATGGADPGNHAGGNTSAEGALNADGTVGSDG